MVDLQGRGIDKIIKGDKMKDKETIYIDSYDFKDMNSDKVETFFKAVSFLIANEMRDGGAGAFVSGQYIPYDQCLYISNALATHKIEIAEMLQTNKEREGE